MCRVKNISNNELRYAKTTRLVDITLNDIVIRTKNKFIFLIKIKFDIVFSAFLLVKNVEDLLSI